VNNVCPDKDKDKDKDKQNPNTQTLVLKHPSYNHTDYESGKEPSCEIQCKAEVTESINHSRNELQDGKASAVISHLDAAQKTLNSTDAKSK
jgi:hypothetical protein